MIDKEKTDYKAEAEGNQAQAWIGPYKSMIIITQWNISAVLKMCVKC